MMRDLLSRLPVRSSERLVVTLAFWWFFLLMAGYQILRPIRESFVSDLPRDEKPVLFSIVFFVMLAAVPIYGWIASVVSRKWLPNVVFHFFIAHLVAFAVWFSLGAEEQTVWQARVFFVWLTVFSLFATSVFWSVMADMFSRAQGERLFGPIAAGATSGGIFGAAIATRLSTKLGLVWLLVIAMGCLEAGLALAIWLQRKRVSRSEDRLQEVKLTVESAQKKGVWVGLIDVVTSPYLRMVALYIALISFCGTVVYMQLTDEAKVAIPDRNERISFFASLNLYTQLGTLFVQLLLIGPMMKRFGLGLVLSVLPIICALSFALLGVSSSLMVLGWVDVLTRIGAYGVTVPAREVMFTVVRPSQKYKAKNVIDTVVLRGSDAVASSFYAAIARVAAGSSFISWLMLPITFAWVGVAWWLKVKTSKRQTL